MKRLFIILLSFLATQAEARKIECSAYGVDIHGVDDGRICYVVSSTFEINLADLKYKYSSDYDLRPHARFCGWPPIGEYFEGSLMLIESGRKDSPALYNEKMYEFVGKLEGNRLILREGIKTYLTYKNAQHEFTLNCVEK